MSSQDAPAPRLPPSAVQAYVFGAFKIDLATFELSRDDHVLTITPKAFDTLLMLVQNRNRAVGKDELMKAVWPDAFVSEDSLTQSVSVLRRAFGDDPAHPRFIVTVARRGYRFIAPVREILPDGATGDSTFADPAPAMAGAPVPATAAAPADSSRKRRRHLLGIGAALAGAALVAALLAARVIVAMRPASPTGRMLRFAQAAPEGTALESGGLVSPGGTAIAFVARDNRSGRTQLWIRALASDQVRPLAGTDGAIRPFWSPDDQSLGFFSGGRLKRIDLVTGSIQSIAAVAASTDPGGAWSGRGVVMFNGLRTGLFSIPATGGDVAVVTSLDPAAQEVAHRFPQFLPDGRHFLFFIDSVQPERRGTYVGSLDAKERVRLVEQPAHYAPPGFLLYVRDRALLAQPFDAGRLQLTAAPSTLAANVSAPDRSNGALVSASPEMVVFSASRSVEHLVWFNRAGQRLSAIDAPFGLRNPTFSRDEKRMLVAGFDDPERRGIWMVELERGSITRLTADGMRPFESPDGANVAFVSDRLAGVTDIYLRPTSARNDEADLVFRSTENKSVCDWSPDGRSLLYVNTSPRTKADLWLLPIIGPRQPVPLLQTSFNELQGQISPDGRWIAYTSDESGSWQVYVQSFPALGAKRAISVGGGWDPHWRRDGKELFYVGADRSMMAVPIRHGTPLEAGAATALFRAPISGVNVYRTDYAVSGDGQRFLIDAIDGADKDDSISVIVNWLTAIKR
jgi:DNA-binding winged helix-turn-helix (wHTH) protein/Tol biopolymer transport system component